MLLTGETNNVMNAYPELESKALSVNLEMFVQHYKPRTVYFTKEAFQLISGDTYLLFSQVEQLCL